MNSKLLNAIIIAVVIGLMIMITIRILPFLSEKYNEEAKFKELYGEPSYIDPTIYMWTDDNGNRHAVIIIEGQEYEVEIRKIER